ncbi:hypothetical protein U0070_000702 [Myodes glareolus]|uniref:Secreted protein n=1 Tax=Myodes glareolus TaxID=447135 RepID=A0AAW0IH73_MYOGA
MNSFWVAVFPTYFLSSSCCVPLDPCPSIPHSLSPKPVLCERLCAGLLALRTRKSKKINHPPGGAGDHLPQYSQLVAGLGQACVTVAVGTEKHLGCSCSGCMLPCQLLERNTVSPAPQQPLVTSLSQLFLKSAAHLESGTDLPLSLTCCPPPWKYLVTAPVIEPSAPLPNLSKSHTQSPLPVLRIAARPTSPNAGGHYVSKETNAFSSRISQSRTLL